MANIPELAAGRLSLFADTSSVGRSIGKVFQGGDRQASKAGDRWGALLGKTMSKSFDKSKPDMDKLADDVTKAEKRITAETERGAKAQALAKAKAEAAQAKYNEAVEKGGKETARAKTAAVALMNAENNLEKQTLETTSKLEKLNSELAESKNAYQNGEKAADAYTKGWKGLGNKLKGHIENAFDKNLDQSRRSRDEGDTASDAYASGWTGLGSKLVGHTVAAVVIAGIAATAVAKMQGNNAGKAYAEGFASGIARLSGARLIGDIGADFGEWVGNLDKSSPKIALVSTALFTLSSALLGAIGNTLSLGASILSIFPAALALPGILLSGGLAVGVFAMAWVDVGDKLHDTIQALQTFRKTISESFWAEAQHPIGILVRELLPALETGIKGVGTALGSLVAAFAQEILGSLPSGELAQIVGYTEESLWNLHAAVAPVTEALMTLGTVGASYMPVLSDWIVRLATDFNSWLQAAEADGRLKGWIDQGIQSMKDFGSVIYFTSAILSTLTEAFRDAGWDATLGGMADSLERMNAALEGPLGQGFMENILGGARSGFDNLQPGIDAFTNALWLMGPTFETLMNLSGTFFSTFLEHISAILANPTFQQGLVSFFGGALVAIEALTPAMGPLGDMFGVLAETVGLFLAEMGPVMGEIFAAMAPIFADVLEAIQPLIPVLADTLLAAFRALLPVIVTLAILFIDKVVPILEKLCHWIIENADWLVPLVAGVLLLAAVLIPLVVGTVALITALGAAYTAFTVVIGVLSAITVPMLAVAGVIALLVISVIGMWITWNRIWDWMKRKIADVTFWIVNTAIPWIAEKIAWLGTKWEQLKNIVAGVWNAIRTKIAEVAGWFANTVLDFRLKIQSLQNKFQSMKDAVGITWNAFKNKLLSGYNDIKSKVLDKLANAVRNGLPNAFQKAKDAIQDIWNGIKNVVKDPLKIVLRDILQNGLISKVNSILDNVDKKKTIPRIPSVWPIAGFRKGGYTGNVGKDEVAGVVHGRENVTAAEPSADIERKYPGLFGAMNKNGAAAVDHLVGGEHGAAAGGPGGPGGGLWSSLQNRIYSSGVAHLAGSISGVNMDSVARAWNNMSNVNIKRGRGENQINASNGGSLGNWGYAWTSGNFEVSPVVPGGMKLPVAIHELGHVLGLEHDSSGNSIMHPMMQGPPWPGAYDRQTMQRIYGGAGKGNAPEGGGGGSFLDRITGWLTDKLSPLTNFLKGVGGMFSSKLPEGGLFADMAKASVTRITDKIGDLMKDKIKGFFSDDEGSGARGKLPLYDNGGKLYPGRTTLENKTGKVERVLTQEQWHLQEKNAELVESHTLDRGEIIVNVEREKGEDGYALGNAIGNRLAFSASRR